MAEDTKNAFLTDVQTLRENAKKSLDDGAVTPTYKGDVKKTIDILQAVVATELVCVLRYTMHAISVEGLTSESVGNEFNEHAASERKHMLAAANRIDQLGGVPNFNPEGLATRSATEYGNGGNLVEMVKQDLIAERVVIEHYQELIRYFGDNDPTTRIMLEGFLADEEDHATDLHDLLVAHEGKPFLN
ncbi:MULTISPECIES: ferritin-like domain-containing protein [Gluconobacter]|uniref:Bacterioferritin n=3 Tax=Gluconobacter TaxID=441 RepID=A0A149RSN5_GLUOY|nr:MULTISPECIES: ferritin-like domain-containing protein [Gluconobacter]KXV17333.1 bacterioferritin [Gluconobacter oxydans]KXV44113.1 bacterioferritin [Gluconobacter roseus]MBF0857662.1 ferritin-like domain-containing protein [Gluconobacter vitians]GBR45175.1 bacterioferritin [Gluconobacter roseus NBRC 3990]GEB02871.1 bacterioferritin [Gluconobacter roseus NBRC 3990]